MIPELKKLTGEQYKELQEALLQAFNSFDDFKQMFRYTFDEALSNIITDKDNLKNLAFNLIEWAEKEGCLNQLIDGSLKARPQNPQLLAFVNNISPKEINPTLVNNKYFTSNVLISELSPQDILGSRVKKYKEFYYERDFDTELYERVLNGGENILLLGNSLAGKTRAIFEVLKKISKVNSNICILFPQNEVLDSPIEIPLIEGYKHIAFIEDIDDYYKGDKSKKRNYDKMLQALIQKDVQILATCRTGPEYKEFKKLSYVKTREIFKVITIEKVSKEINNNIDKELIIDIDIEKSEFDGNIGSIFMDLLKMRTRYEELEQDSQNEIAKLAIRFLQALRAFYFASNFISKSTYDAQTVNDYCLRLAVGKSASPIKEYANELEAKLKHISLQNFKDKIDQYHENIDQALKLLDSDEDNLNFIVHTDYWVKIEEVYLEKIVKYNPFTIVKNINDLYDAPGEKEKNGFYVRTENYNIALRNLSSYSHAVSFFNRIQKEKGIKPNSETYCVLIEKSFDFQTALIWFNQLKERKLPVTSSIMIELINKCENYQAALIYLEETLALLAKETENNPDVDYEYQRLTSILVPKMHTEEQAADYLMSFFEKTIPISSFVFNKIISKTDFNVNLCLAWMEKFEIDSDKITLVILIQKTTSLQEGLSLLGDSKFENIPWDSTTLNNLAQKTTSLQEGLDLLEHEKFKNIQRDSATLKSLLQKTTSLQEGLDLLENEKFKNIQGDFATLNSLLQKIASLQEGLDLLENEKFINIQGDPATLNSLLQKTASLQEGLDLLENDKFINIQGDSATLNSLLRKTASLQEGLDLLENEKFINITWNTGTLNTLLHKTVSLQEGLDLLENEKFKNIQRDAVTLSKLIEKTIYLQEGLGILENEKFKNIHLESGLFNQLLYRAQSTLEIKEIVKLAASHSISLINHAFFQSFPNYLSSYQDLSGFPFFWKNYKAFQFFDFLEQSFSSFEEAVSYFQDFTPKTRFMCNHMLFILLNQNLLTSPNQKLEIWEIIKNGYQGENEERKKYWDRLLFPDIQVIWDSYVFKT